MEGSTLASSPDCWQVLEKAGSLTPEVRSCIIGRYGERGRKALQAVDEDRVKVYRDFYVVVGRSDEYVVEDDFCVCSDFLFRGKGVPCSHILAVRIAKAVGKAESYPIWYVDCMRKSMQ